MRAAFIEIERLAPYKGTVLLLGESGTGKELVARALHRLGPFLKGPFISFNCSTLVDGLAESQLFGHVKGAFTHAQENQPGCFRLADGGTLLLDEIGELPMPMQSKLLRVSETLEVQAVGSAETHQVDLRLITATNRDLRKMVAAGEFRADLYYRLDVSSIRVPALRDRGYDIEILAGFFIEHYNRLFGKEVRYISRRALALLRDHRWPGNVRELAHAIERATLLGARDRIDVEDLPAEIAQGVAGDGPHSGGTRHPGGHDADSARGDAAAPVSLDDVMKTAVQRALLQAHGDCAKAAKLLGISRPAIYRKMARYGITSAMTRTLRGGKFDPSFDGAADGNDRDAADE